MAHTDGVIPISVRKTQVIRHHCHPVQHVHCSFSHSAPRGEGRRLREDLAPGRLLLVLKAVLVVDQR